MLSKHEQERKNGKLQMWLLIGAVVMALSVATFETYAKEDGVNVDPDVPEPVSKIEPQSKWSLGYWSNAAGKRWNEKEVMNDTIETLTIQLRQANIKLLGFDEILELANQQEARTTDHFESLLKAGRLEVSTFRSKNEALNQAIKDLQTKDSSMTYVPGCWVSNESVQATTP